MQPLLVEQEIKTRTDTKVASTLQPELTEVGTGVSGTTNISSISPWWKPCNLERADPAWELRPAPGRRLSGVQLVHTVVGLPRGTKAIARVTLRADISRKGLLGCYEARRADEREEVCTIQLP